MLLNATDNIPVFIKCIIEFNFVIKISKVKTFDEQYIKK